MSDSPFGKKQKNGEARAAQNSGVESRLASGQPQSDLLPDALAQETINLDELNMDNLEAFFPSEELGSKEETCNVEAGDIVAAPATKDDPSGSETRTERRRKRRALISAPVRV